MKLKDNCVFSENEDGCSASRKSNKVHIHTHTLKHRINNLLDVVQATGVRLENRCMVKHLIKCNAQENNI